MFMGGPQHAGVAVADAAFEKLAPSWQFRASGAFSASPVAVGKQLFAASEDGNLYALDFETRGLQWLYHARAGIASTPAVADGTVYFLSRDGRFHAVEALSGKPLWSFRTQGEAQFATHGLYGLPKGEEQPTDPWDFYLSSPLVHNGKVYFGSSDERVYALDARSGKLLWAYKTGGMVHSSPALSGANIVVGSWDGAVYALDAETGEQRWRVQTETEQKTSVALGVQASPTVDGDTVYVGSRDGHLYALDAASGKQRWLYQTDESRRDAYGIIDKTNGKFDSARMFGTEPHMLYSGMEHVKRLGAFAASPLWHRGQLVLATADGRLLFFSAPAR